MRKGRHTLDYLVKKSIIGLKDSWRITMLTSIFVCGLIIGTFIIKNSDNSLNTQIESIICSFVTRRASDSFIVVFLYSLLPSALFIYLAFSSGLCALGIPLVSILPLIKGLGVGIFGAYLYKNFSIHGVCYCLLLFFPAAIFTTATLIYACNESMYMSSDIYAQLKEKQYEKGANGFKLYLTRYLILTVFIIVISLIDALLSASFSGLFNLF